MGRRSVFQTTGTRWTHESHAVHSIASDVLMLCMHRCHLCRPCFPAAHFNALPPLSSSSSPQAPRTCGPERGREQTSRRPPLTLSAPCSPFPDSNCGGGQERARITQALQLLTHPHIHRFRARRVNDEPGRAHLIIDESAGSDASVSGASREVRKRLRRPRIPVAVLGLPRPVAPCAGGASDQMGAIPALTVTTRDETQSLS